MFHILYFLTIRFFFLELRNSESDGDSTGEGEEDGGDDADADADISYVQDTSFLKVKYDFHDSSIG